MNGATLLSATVVINSSANLNDTITYSTNKEKLIESNDENDDSDSDSDEEEFIDYEESSKIHVSNDISNSNDPSFSSDQKNSSNSNSPERKNSIATTARLRTNRKSKCIESSNNKLDPVRFSMYAIQNSQLNEIDALLSELNQLQNTLDYSAVKNIPENYIDQTNEMNTIIPIKPLSSSSSNYLSSVGNNNNHNDEIEAIDQQFDEVLKFLAQSINEQTGISSSSASPSATSSPSSVSLIQNHQKKDRSSGGSSSSNSSGIGDDFESSSIVKCKTQNNNTDLKEQQTKQQLQSKKRNSSDSAFLETISMPSSHSLTTIDTNNRNLNKSNIAQPNSMNVSSSSCADGGSSEPSPVSQKSKDSNDNVIMEKCLTSTQMAEAQKAEMIRIALEKLKEANIKKLIVKAYTDDGCTKSVIIDETMKCYDVMLLLFSKNHTKPSVKYSVVEYLPKFHMERIFEDHENIVEAMSNWSRDSDNQIIFTEKEAKYDLFLRPELYLLSEPNSKIDEAQKNKLLNEFFQNIGSPVPELEGPLYIKVESKKSWKKYYCVLRQSGLYYIPKGKNKKDLQCLFNFDKLDLYYGIDWRKKYKSPTNSCFALKYPQVQKKSSKYIKYICCENDQDMKRWFNGIRIAKFGKQLYENYKKILELIEMNKVSGRLPMASSRRLSASINNKNQRPRSSYSLISGTNSEDNANNLSFTSANTTNTIINNKENANANTQKIESSSTTGSTFNLDSHSTSKMNNLLINNSCNESSSSLLMRQQSSESKINTSMKELVASELKVVKQQQNQLKEEQQKEEIFKQKLTNMSYTDQLKSLLEAHQTLNQQQDKQKTMNKVIEPMGSILNTNLINKPWTSPISISTSNINNVNTVQFSPNSNKKGKIPLNTDVTKQMFNNAALGSSSVSSLSPISQQLFLSSPNLSDSNNDLLKSKERPEPPRQLELDTNIPLKATKSTQLISPTSLNKTEIKIDISGFKMNSPTEPESIYDLPTPPMEIFNTPPQLSDYDPIGKNLTSLPSPTSLLQSSIPTVQSQIIVQLADNRNSKTCVPQVAPKPVFKRINSFNSAISNEPDVGIVKTNNIKPNDIQSKERKSFGSTNSNHFRGSSLSRTSSLLQQQQQQQQNDAANELTAILARQKKKIEEQTGDIDSNTNHSISNGIRITSPNVSKKPPPPPRSERSHSFTRKMSNEY